MSSHESYMQAMKALNTCRRSPGKHHAHSWLPVGFRNVSHGVALHCLIGPIVCNKVISLYIAPSQLSSPEGFAKEALSQGVPRLTFLCLCVRPTTAMPRVHEQFSAICTLLLDERRT